MPKHHFGFLVAGTFLITTAVGQASWYTAADGTNYLIDPNCDTDWYDSLLDCASHNLSLVTIASEEKYMALKDVLMLAAADGIDFWIGGLYSPATGLYYWAETGKEFQNTQWSSNPFIDYDDNKECVYMEAYDFLWNTKDCSEINFGTLCEERPRLLEDSKKKDVGDLQALEPQLNDAKRTIDNLLLSLHGDVPTGREKNHTKSYHISVKL